MNTTKISFTNKSLIEPVIFMATAFFAGTPRLIQYFPGATKGGLLLTGGLAGAACVLHDKRYEGKDFTSLRKLTAIGLASLISLGLTQSLKGRVSLSFANILKIVFFGGAITLLKNWVEHSPAKTKAESGAPATSGTLGDKETLAPFSRSACEIRIEAGSNISCTIYQSGEGTKGTVTLIDHVYEAKDRNGRKGLLMRHEDFKTLQSNVCHRGAFGDDYREVGGDSLSEYGFQAVENSTFMFLWKIPADLKHIATYVVDESVPYTEHDVGKYSLLSDISPEGLSQTTQGILTSLQSTSATKIRTDFSDGMTPSTHHLILQDGKTHVPGISTATFFNNFNAPKLDEIERVKILLKTLATLGFGAYLCNRHQHMAIIGSYQNKAISPQELADLFHNNAALKGEVLKALEAAATEQSFDGKNMKKQVSSWINSFIIRFTFESQ